MSKVNTAVESFEGGFSCSQAILSTYGIEFGLDRESALKLADSFSGGMGHLGEVCGAVTGAFMVIGLKYGRTDANDAESRKRTDALVNEFAKRFISRNESILCRDLLGIDISTPEGLEHARARKVFSNLCPNYVKDAAEILEEIL